MSEGAAANVANVPARQLWVGHVPDAVVAAELCRRREGEGFHGVNFGDSQNRYGDPYVAMALGISSTSTLELGTLVTNPITRHPAVTAAAAGSLQAASRGRVSIGIGTGDSALAHLGAAPAPLAVLARYVSMLRAYGAGSEVSFEDSLACLPRAGRDLPVVESLALSGRPAVSQIQWLPGDEDPVPINVFATGPKTIDMAAAVGDRVTFSVGADPRRVRWAIDRARNACAAAGKDPALLDIGASVVVGLHDDADTARAMIAATVATTPAGPSCTARPRDRSHEMPNQC
ncbi:MAG: LLM class flavin-dependent oxidoreductase [Acidimicrobiia bacterium]